MAEIERSKDAPLSDRRGTERKKLFISVQFEGGDGTGVASTRDISPGGLYMSTTAMLEQGTPIVMSLGFGPKTMNINGVVVYSDPGYGVGVRFRDLDEDEEKLLAGELALT
ncbi:MAG: PilZ domain-containing protein [Acidobacteriota bacterium]